MLETRRDAHASIQHTCGKSARSKPPAAHESFTAGSLPNKYRTNLDEIYQRTALMAGGAWAAVSHPSNR